MSRRLVIALLFSLTFGVPCSRAETVWYPLPKEAYAFGKRYPDAQSLLFAFDYGHALIYEKLLSIRGKGIDPAAVERELLSQILSILKNPPIVKPSEESIAPNYTYSFPLIINLFDWSHDLHQFVYDILASYQDRGSSTVKRVQEVFAKYQSEPNVAITSACKTMLFMDGQYFSKAFRRTFPSLNLLIWSYHWYQIKLYEALMSPNQGDRDRAVAGTITGFRNLVSNLPDSADFDMMPETSKEAPIFAKLFPGLPPTFDNLHSLHDVLSDILVSDKVSTEQVVPEAFRFGRMAQDPKAFAAAQCPGRQEK